MLGFPVHCDNCGATQVVNIPWLSQFGTVEIDTCGTICPRCGQSARILDATYDFVEEMTRVRSASPETLRILATLQQAMRSAKDGRPVDEVLAPIEQASPQFAEFARKAVAKGGVNFLVLALLYLLTTCAQHTQGTINWNQLVDQAHFYLTGDEPYPAPASKPAPQSTGTVEKAPRSPPEARSGPNRQQRRQQERQAKKHQRQIERQAAQKPAAPRKPKH